MVFTAIRQLHAQNINLLYHISQVLFHIFFEKSGFLRSLKCVWPVRAVDNLLRIRYFISMRKTVKNIVIILLLLTLGVSTAFLSYLLFFAPGGRELSGEWTARLDMTEEASAAALGWLQDMEAVSVSLEDMEAYMGDLTVQVNLVLERTGRSEGTFRCNVLPESYDACSQAAYEAFAEAFRDLLAERLRMAGYAGGTDGESVEALVTETFGMSTVSYLMLCCPDLLPSLEALQARYDGSGTYETADGVLTRRYEDGGVVTARKERYIRQDSELILLELILNEETDPAAPVLFSDQYPVRYTLKHP